MATLSRKRLVLNLLLPLLLFFSDNAIVKGQNATEISNSIPLKTVKKDTDSDGEPDLNGERVTVAGRANIATGLLHETYLQIFIQNQDVGLSLFSQEFDRPIQPGDSVIATGRVQQYFGLTEVEVEEYRVIEAPSRRYPPVPLSNVLENPHPYEGMLVAGEGTVVDKGSRFNGKYLTISPGEDTQEQIMIYVSNFHSQYRDFDFETPTIGDDISVTGVLSQYDPDYPNSSTFKVFLRTPQDLAYVGVPRWYMIVGGGVLVFAIVLVGGWVISLKSQVRSQTRQISDALEEREVLLREIHHRVKNNLAIISGLIGLQESQVEDETAQRVLQDTQTKIKSMAIVHDKLYQSSSLSRVSMKTYLEELARAIHKTISGESNNVDLQLQIEEVELEVSKAIPIGLLVNELMVNAYKHAFNGQADATLRIGLFQSAENLKLEIRDNGVGFPEDFDPSDTDSLGILLIQTFARQLNAEMQIDNHEGACISFSIPTNDGQ